MNDAAVVELFAGARLTPTQRRIAHTLVENAGAAAYLSAAEVAELAGVSQPSVTRLALSLGYDGYPGLRRRLRDLAGGPNGAADGGNELQGAVRNELQGAVRAEAENLGRLADRLADGTAVRRAGALLAGTPVLPVLGLRASAPVAAYFGYFAAKVHPDVRLFDGGGSLLGDRIAQAGAAGATAMLAVVLPRYPKEAIDALGEARELGIRSVVITDSAVGPAAGAAGVALSAPVGERLVFDLHAAPMALAMVLLQAMCDAEPGRAQRRLEEFDRSAARRRVFVP